jgi:hypothetical protein
MSDLEENLTEVYFLNEHELYCMFALELYRDVCLYSMTVRLRLAKSFPTTFCQEQSLKATNIQSQLDW